MLVARLRSVSYGPHEADSADDRFGHAVCLKTGKWNPCARSIHMPETLAFKGAFKAADDDGAVYLIDVFEIMCNRLDDAVRGPLLYRTADGGAVKRLETGIYVIEETGLVVRSLPEGSSVSDHHAVSG
jgi:hypothetical protein